MADYKYIILEKGNQELPVIFPGNFVHAHVAETIRVMLAMEALSLMPEAMRNNDKVKRDLLDAVRPVAAGEVTMGFIDAFGKSETLGLSSRVQDRSLMQAFPYMHGIKL